MYVIIIIIIVIVVIIMCSCTVECPAPGLECPGSRGFYQDNCSFSCNPGYELRGPSNGTCLADQNWSEGDPLCVVLNCSTSPPLDNSQLQSPCDTQYQSTCTVMCDLGYSRDVTNITYLCNTTADPDMVEWEKIRQASCERGTDYIMVSMTKNYVAYCIPIICMQCCLKTKCHESYERPILE